MELGRCNQQPPSCFNYRKRTIIVPNKFDIGSIFSESREAFISSEPERSKSDYYTKVKEIIDMAKFPGLKVSEDEFSSGGWFNKEKTTMVHIWIEGGKLEGLEAYFRAQVFGNVIVVSCFRSIERGMLDSISGKSGDELYSIMRKKCKNVLQYEEFVAIDSLCRIVFDGAHKKAVGSR
jgi:hypothetical protein